MSRRPSEHLLALTLTLPVALGVTAHAAATAGQSAGAVPGATANAIDQRVARSFVLELQRGLARDDRAAVAALIAYPMTVYAGGLRIPIRDAAVLLESYDVIFPPNLKDIVAQARIVDGGLSATYRIVLTPGGLSIAGDVIEARSIDGGLRITRITVPLSPPADGAGAAAPRADVSAPREPRRLIFGSGLRSTFVSGALAPGGRASYIFSAVKSQWIEVRVDRVPGRAIVVHVLDEKRRTALDARARAGARLWTGQMPASGQYRIEVERVIPTGPAALPYDLVVTLK
jgi:hypothetical protein